MALEPSGIMKTICLNVLWESTSTSMEEGRGYK